MPDRRAIEKARASGFGGAVVPVGKGLEEGKNGKKETMSKLTTKPKSVLTPTPERRKTSPPRPSRSKTTPPAASPAAAVSGSPSSDGRRGKRDNKRRGSVGRRSSITAMARRGVAAELSKTQELRQRSMRERNRRRASIT